MLLPALVVVVVVVVVVAAVAPEASSVSPLHVLVLPWLRGQRHVAEDQ